MDRNFIKNGVLYQGCISLGPESLRSLFPSIMALESWCRVNRIDFEVDQTTKVVYFTPAGVFVPSQL